ncbi:MAG: transposase, partial [Zoogloeaceae bacterium]|nr:transposase [Zoogloeaceae bacterium]
AECVNAQGRNRGLRQFRIRGLAKVKRVALFFVLAHNLMRRDELALRLLGVGRGASPPFPEWAFEGERPMKKG